MSADKRPDGLYRVVMVRARVNDALARLWLWRHSRTLANTPSWRLMQELRRRGTLRDAPASEAGFTKGTTGRLGTVGGIAVDSRGLPLLQQAVDVAGEEA